MTFIPTHAQQLVIIQWMDSCIPKEEEEISGKSLSACVIKGALSAKS